MGGGGSALCSPYFRFSTEVLSEGFVELTSPCSGLWQLDIKQLSLFGCKKLDMASTVDLIVLHFKNIEVLGIGGTKKATNPQEDAFDHTAWCMVFSCFTIAHVALAVWQVASAHASTSAMPIRCGLLSASMGGIIGDPYAHGANGASVRHARADVPWWWVAVIPPWGIWALAMAYPARDLDGPACS